MQRDSIPVVVSTGTPTQTRCSRGIHWIGTMVSLLSMVAISSYGQAGSPAPMSSAADAPASPAPAVTVGAAAISIKSFMYSPDRLTVSVGTTVTWKNQDDEAHTVRGADALIRSNALDQDDTYSVKFDKPGTYSYGCSLHPTMHGTIVVK